MFIQVYFHRTRRFFDIILLEALKQILPNGVYPNLTNEYIKWDDNRVIQLMKECNNIRECKWIMQRTVFPIIIKTKPHPQTGDKRYFELQKKQLVQQFGEDYFLEDYSADKLPHKIPMKVDMENEKAIVIVNKKTKQLSMISDESHIISHLTEKINIKRLYVCSGRVVTLNKTGTKK